ncbi:MAG: glycosyltransferase family 25 protein, partial [Shewanella sp.]
MIPIFVISLLRSHERREAIEKQMARLGLSFTFFDAVDGKLLNDNDLSKVDLKLAKVFCGHSLSLGEVGC